jgi:tetratricopeptide (TPR) repeat protein
MGSDRKISFDFNFRVPALPEGQAMTVEEAESLLLAEVEESRGTSKQALWNLAILYSGTRRHRDARSCIERLRAMAEGAEERAECVLALGRHHEQVGDFEAAVACYRSAFDLAPESADTSYWIHNNLGYSLIQLGRHREAEASLRAAMAIDPRRPNAYKNLGLALDGQGQHAEAAEHFVLATQANAADGRSLQHLESLVAEHPQVLLACPDLPKKLEACRLAVREAASAQPDYEAHWTRLREKRTPN